MRLLPLCHELRRSLLEHLDQCLGGMTVVLALHSAVLLPRFSCIQDQHIPRSGCMELLTM